MATCLETTAAQNWSEAARICAMALTAEPGNEKIKAALDTANQALAADPKAAESQALSTAPEAASDAADDAAEKAEDEAPN